MRHTHTHTYTPAHHISLEQHALHNAHTRASTLFEAARVLCLLVQKDYKTICFCKVRTHTHTHTHTHTYT